MSENTKNNYTNREMEGLRKDLEDFTFYFEEFATSLPLPVLSVNPIGTIIDVNLAFEKLIGIERVKILGENVGKFFLEKKRLKSFQEIVMQGNSVEKEEMILLSHKGKIPTSIYLSPRQDKDGKISGYFVGIFNITAFKDLQESLEKKVIERTKNLENARKALLNILEDVGEERERAEEERDKTSAIIKNFADGLLLIENTKITLLNPKAIEMFKLKDSDIIGKSIVQLAKNEKLGSLIGLLRKHGMDFAREEFILDSGIVLEVSTTPVLQKGKGFGRMIILHDITREKFVEQMKTEFVSIAAHQLRTPISAIKWIIKMLMDGDLGDVSKNQADYLKKAYVSNERMIRLINDLLNVTRIEEGRFLYNAKKENIIKVMEKALIPLEAAAQRKGIGFRLECPKEDVPETYIDADKFSLAIQNLTDNAIRYTAKGEVSALVEYKKDKKEFLITIKDTGIGIPKDQQKRVFSRFFRAGNAVKAETSGTGLGLFIAKNIIEAHQGKIAFESVEDKGSSFYFTLPIKTKTEFEGFVENL